MTCCNFSFAPTSKFMILYLYPLKTKQYCKRCTLWRNTQSLRRSSSLSKWRTVSLMTGRIMLAFCASIVANSKTVNTIICGFNVPNFSQIRQYRNKFIDVQLSTALERVLTLLRLLWRWRQYVPPDRSYLQCILAFQTALWPSRLVFFPFRSL